MLELCTNQKVEPCLPQLASGQQRAPFLHASSLGVCCSFTPLCGNACRQPQKQTRLSLKPPPQSLSPQQDALDPLAQDPNCRYRKLGHVNDGSSGFVLLAEDVHTHEKVAIKFLERGTKVIKDSDREICNLRLCCMHPYIVRFKEVGVQCMSKGVFRPDYGQLSF